MNQLLSVLGASAGPQSSDEDEDESMSESEDGKCGNFFVNLH